MENKYIHRQAGHCETGMTANLLSHIGFNITESLVFGIGGGLFFGYLPFVRINSLPLISYRILPFGIFKRATSRLGVKYKRFQFRNRELAMQSMDDLIQKGIPVGAQVGVFWLPFFPPALRSHFNAHFIVVFEKNGDEYQIGDPVFEHPKSCGRDDLMMARFAPGFSTPKGKMHYLLNEPDPSLLKSAIYTGIKDVCKNMLAPFPLIGVKGIQYLARQLKKWPEKFDQERINNYLSQLIRMQEEIGTGGAGFRYIYASFLQEIAGILEVDKFRDLSEQMTAVGDLWREVALGAARQCKGRAKAEHSCAMLADLLFECADREKRIYQDLKDQIN